MKHLAGVRRLQHVDVVSTRIGDEGLRSLRESVDLWFLNIGDTDISENGLPFVLTFPRLEDLKIYNLPVTDELLRRICDLPQLSSLVVGGEKMRLSSVSVSSLEKLQKVHLIHTPLVDDDWLEPLGKLTALTELNLKGTKVTAAGVEKLHTVLPRCRIFSDHGTIEPVPAPAEPQGIEPR